MSILGGSHRLDSYNTHTECSTAHCQCYKDNAPFFKTLIQRIHLKSGHPFSRCDFSELNHGKAAEVYRSIVSEIVSLRIMMAVSPNLSLEKKNTSR